MNGVPLTSTSGEAMGFCVKFVLLLSQEKGIPNTLSVNCKLTCVLLSFLIGKFAKTGSLFNSQFTVQFLTHMSLPYLETKAHAINVT